jgi:hypothetical protein
MEANNNNNNSNTKRKSRRYWSGAGWAKVVSASVGSTITALAVTPLEVVKVRQQHASASTANIHKVPKNAVPCPSGCGTFILNTGLGEYLTPKNKCKYFDTVTGNIKQSKEITYSRGTLRMLRSIFKNEGLAGIYAGLGPTLVMGKRCRIGLVLR